MSEDEWTHLVVVPVRRSEIEPDNPLAYRLLEPLPVGTVRIEHLKPLAALRPDWEEGVIWAFVNEEKGERDLAQWEATKKRMRGER